MPDRRLHNRQVEDLLRMIGGMFRSPLQRWNGRWFDPPELAAWELVLSHRAATFCLTAPAAWREVLRKQLSVAWPRVTIEEAGDPFAGLSPTAVSRLELKQHYMFALKVDRRTAGVVPSLLETTRLLGEGDRVGVQIILDPAPPDWWHGAAVAYDRFRSGYMPRRVRLDGREIGQIALRGTTYAVLEVIGIISELLSGELPEPVALDGPSKAQALRERPVGATVADKLRQDALDTTIRVAVQASDPLAAQTIMRSVAYAFRAVDGDNALVEVREAPGTAWQRMQARRPGLKLNADYLSLSEAAMLVQLPTGPLQEEYGLVSVAHTETDLPAAVTSGGLRIGVATYRGRTTPVYLPTGSVDELCLPHVVIGGMGTGKTRGFAGNLVVEAVRNGLSAVVIDPAKGEIGDEAEAGLPGDLLVRIRFGRNPVALDWREVRHGDRARNRLASELVAFCEAAAEEAGAQTVRYLRSAAKAVPTGRLADIVSLMTDKAFRERMLPAMRPQERAVWTAFGALTDARQAQVAMPVLNRLDVILGDDYLASCMDARTGIDFVELLQKPRALILDLPKAHLGAEAVDVLASLLATKLDLAMTLRRSTHPTFVIMDEPHQYLRSARTWRAAAVESRKWRFSHVWLFHAWEQLPRDLAHIIKAAGPHYHLYTTSKETYRALAEEIAPFSVEEALRTPRHSALHVIRAGGQVIPPFLAKMDPPPSTTAGRGAKPGCL